MEANNDSAQNKRDWPEFVYKILTGIVLAVIPIVIKYGADNIANSLQSGELVKKLVDDLTTEQQKTRQDIALIALDGAIGERQPEMVSKIAETILISRKGFDDDQSIEFGGVAFNIIANRTPERKEIVARYLRNKPDPNMAAEVLSQGYSNEDLRQPDSQRGELLAQVFSRVVYIQFKDEKNKELAKQLQQFLKESNFACPGVERIDKDFNNSIRYFNEEDKDLATHVAKRVDEFFRSQGIPISFPAPTKLNLKAPRGQIEVWFALAASAR